MPTGSAFTRDATTATTTQSVLTRHHRVWRRAGFWCLYGSARPQTTTLYVLYSALVHLLVYGISFGTLAVYLCSDGPRLSDRIDAAIIAMPLLLATLKAPLIWRQRHRLTELYAVGAELDAFVRTGGQRRLVAEQVHESDRLASVVLWMYTISSIGQGLKALLVAGRELIWPAWFPVDWRSPERGPAVYVALVLHQWMTCFVCVAVLSSLDVLTPVLFKVLGAHLVVLGDQLEKMTTAAELRQCIEYHTLCLRFLHLANTIQSANNMMQFSSSGMIICAGEFQLSMFDPRTQLPEMMVTAVFILCTLLQVCFPCYYGSGLLWRSEQLSHQLLAGNWHGSLAAQTPSFRSSLLLIGEAVRRPMNPAASNGLLPIVLPTMVVVGASGSSVRKNEIVKSAYSMFAFLQQVAMD